MSNGGRTATGDVADLKNRANRGRRVQLHFWVHEEDYQFLRTLSKQEDETMARIMRRAIRQLRLNAGDIPNKTSSTSPPSAALNCAPLKNNPVPNWYQKH